MVIEKIIGTNFKGFKEMTYEPKEKMTVLTGKNGVGKSRFIQLIRYALTGDLPNDPISYGEEEMSVSVKLGSGTEFSRYINATKPSKITLCGKPSTAKNLTEVLQAETGIEQSVMKISSSAEIIDKMEPDELCQLLLKYIPEEIDFDTVISYIPDVTPEIITELSQILPQMPDKFGTETINEAYEAFAEIRKETKKERDSCKIKANSYIGEPPKRSLADVEKAHEELVKKEASASATVALNKAYKQAVELKEQQDKDIKELTDKINTNTSSKPNPNILSDILAKKKTCNEDILEAGKLQQTLVNTIELLNKTIVDINKPVCPISKELVCTTDRSSIKEELKDSLKDNTEGLEYQKQEIKKLQTVLAGQSQKEEEYRKNFSEYEKKVLLMTQLAGIKKNMIKVPAKPVSVENADYTQAKNELKHEMELVRTYEACRKEKDKLEVFENRVKLYENIVRSLAPKGEVMEGIAKHYISIFESVCNDRAKKLQPDFLIRLIYEDGVKILCQPKAGSDFYPYADLSAGQKAVVVFLLLDMLNALTGFNILILDELGTLDPDVFVNLICLLSDPAVLQDYDHIILCAVNHDDTVKTLTKLNKVDWIKL